MGTEKTCLPDSGGEGAMSAMMVEGRVVELGGGAISPGFMSFGSPLGMEEIAGEPSTGDGRMYNPMESDVPRIVGDVGGVVRAVDGLVFQTRDAM